MDKRSNLNLLILGVLFAITAFDTLLLAFATPGLIEIYNFNRTEAGLLGTSLMVGIALGSIFFGMISDKIGRKPVIFSSVILFSFSTGLLSLFHDFFPLAFFLFTSGLGLGGSLTMTIASLPEVIEGSVEKYMCYLESFWGVGALMIVSAYHMVSKNSISQLFFAGFLPILFIPLFSKLPTIKTEKRRLAGNIWILLTEYRELALVIWLIWFCGVYTYYGVFLWLPDVWLSLGSHSRSTLLIPVYGIQIVSPLILSFFSNRENTESLLFLYSILASISILTFIFLPSYTLRFLSILSASFFSIGSWVLLIIVTQRTYPQSIRGIGVGSSAGIGRIGGIIAPYVTGNLMDKTGSFLAPFLIFSIFFVFQGIFSLETKKIRYRKNVG